MAKCQLLDLYSTFFVKNFLRIDIPSNLADIAESKNRYLNDKGEPLFL